MVARMKPVTNTVAKRIRNSSGVRRMFFHDRRTSTSTSAHHGFANVHATPSLASACHHTLALSINKPLLVVTFPFTNTSDMAVLETLASAFADFAGAGFASQALQNSTSVRTWCGGTGLGLWFSWFRMEGRKL